LGLADRPVALRGLRPEALFQDRKYALYADADAHRRHVLATEHAHQAVVPVHMRVFKGLSIQGLGFRLLLRGARTFTALLQFDLESMEGLHASHLALYVLAAKRSPAGHCTFSRGTLETALSRER
jgi:hypothetical protein